jgi:ParB/RepB/Spo0J family partition protein
MGKYSIKDRVKQNAETVKQNLDVPASPSRSLPVKKVIPDQYTTIPLELIKVRENIRTTFSEESLAELAASFTENGQIEAITVIEREDGFYEVLVGERRYRAAHIAGLKELKCIIRRPYEDEVERIIIQAIENEQREDLNSEDRERYVAFLLSSGLTGSEICRRLGKSPGWLSQVRKAYDTREKHGEAFKEAGIELTTRDAYNLHGASDEAISQAIAETIAAGNTPKAKSEAISNIVKTKERTETRGRKKAAPAPMASPDTPTEYIASVPDVSQHIQTPVQIHECEDSLLDTEEKEISFFSEEHEQSSSTSFSDPSADALSGSAELAVSLSSVQWSMRAEVDETRKHVDLSSSYVGIENDLNLRIVNAITSYYKEKGYTINV